MGASPVITDHVRALQGGLRERRQLAMQWGASLVVTKGSPCGSTPGRERGLLSAGSINVGALQGGSMVRSHMPPLVSK